MRAYCWADGRIEFGQKLPRGALPIARERCGGRMRQIVEGLARKGYEPASLLVPGIPETTDPVQRLEALERFTLQVARRREPGDGITVFTRAHRWPIEGQGKAR